MQCTQIFTQNCYRLPTVGYAIEGLGHFDRIGRCIIAKVPAICEGIFDAVFNEGGDAVDVLDVGIQGGVAADDALEVSEFVEDGGY